MGRISLGADQPRERLVGLDKLSRSRKIDFIRLAFVIKKPCDIFV